MKLKFLKATLASLVLACTSVSATVIDIDFSSLDDAGQFIEFSSQNTGSVSVTDDILTLDTNAWFYITLNDATGINSFDFDNTILSFDFLSTGISEVSGISTSSLNGLHYDNTFNLLGTQNWGLDSISYTEVNEWVRFDINLGEYIEGNRFERITFINDCDNCSGLDVDVSFKNMTLTQVPEPTTMALFALATFGLVSRRIKK